MWLSSGQWDRKVVGWVFFRGSLKQGYIAGKDPVLFSNSSSFHLEWKCDDWSFCCRLRPEATWELKPQVGGGKERHRGTWAHAGCVSPTSDPACLPLHFLYVGQEQLLSCLNHSYFQSVTTSQIYFISETFCFHNTVMYKYFSLCSSLVHRERTWMAGL